MSTITSVQWAAKLDHVREVSLLGTADAAYWQARLQQEELLPVLSDDRRAQLLVIAADGKFMGLRFREVSFSVVVRCPGVERPHDASYLVRAFNSRRFFAFCERLFFSTPYYAGEVREITTFPAVVHLVQKQEGDFLATMANDTTSIERTPLHRGEDGWEGPVFLPPSGRGQRRRGHWFFARLRSLTQTFPFLAGQDSITIRPAPGSQVLQALIDSHFVPQQWIVRDDASHAKSKTYPRGDALTRLSPTE